MRTLKLTLAYDGTDYAGWQFQSHAETVQAAVERTLAKVTQETIRIVGCSRTDAGVHARGQVASFTTETALSNEVLLRALNAELPLDIAALSLDEVPEGFHATHDARSKRYRYSIHDGRPRDVFRLRYSWYYPVRLDAEAMHRAAQPLCGTHDFASFETAGSERLTSVRTISDIVVRRGRGGEADFGTGTESGSEAEDLSIEVEADGFLYKMVRTIVGTLVDVGRGVRSESWPQEVLRAADRRQAGRTAPPQGLCLLQVRYD